MNEDIADYEDITDVEPARTPDEIVEDFALSDTRDQFLTALREAGECYHDYFAEHGLDMCGIGDKRPLKTIHNRLGAILYTFKDDRLDGSGRPPGAQGQAALRIDRYLIGRCTVRVNGRRIRIRRYRRAEDMVSALIEMHATVGAALKADLYEHSRQDELRAPIKIFLEYWMDIAGRPGGKTLEKKDETNIAPEFIRACLRTLFEPNADGVVPDIKASLVVTYMPKPI